MYITAFTCGLSSRGVGCIAKPQAVSDLSVHAVSTAAVASLQGTNKLNPPPSDILAAQNRLIEGFLKGLADGIWGTKSRMALRAFKVANGLTADDKWDEAVGYIRPKQRGHHSRWRRRGDKTRSRRSYGG